MRTGKPQAHGQRRERRPAHGQPFVANQPAVERPAPRIPTGVTPARPPAPSPAPARPAPLPAPATDEVERHFKALLGALRKRLVLGSQQWLAAAIADGVGRALVESGATASAPAAGAGNNRASPDPDETWVSGKEYEQLESMARQKDERIGELRRQTLTAEADVQRLKSELDAKERAIQEKLAQLSNANGENKTLKLQIVDLEGKVRVMRREVEDAAAKTQLAAAETRRAQELQQQAQAQQAELAALRARQAETQANLELAQQALSELKQEATPSKRKAPRRASAPAPAAVARARKPRKPRAKPSEPAPLLPLG